MAQQPVVINSVPANKVDQVMADAKNWGGTNIQKTKNADGTFTVTVTFPD
jgi:hypothetical protein